MKKTVAIIGGGACALMLACALDTKKYSVSLFEKNAALGRKFLVAGYGGLNITHSENLNSFITRYEPKHVMERPLSHFSNTHLINWLHDLGIETYVGSSGRVFPKKGMKPAAVLNSITEAIKRNQVKLYYKFEWKGFSHANDLLFETATGKVTLKFDTVIFCLGGASWPITGSDGRWTDYFTKRDVHCNPFMSSNCAFGVEWHSTIVSKIEGKALKNCVISCGNKKQAGEIVLTRFGIEGSGIYPFSARIREQLRLTGTARVYIDLKPLHSHEQLISKLSAAKKGKNYTERFKSALNLSELHITLLKSLLSKEDFLNPATLVKHLKALEISIYGTAPLEEAISTVGGISLDEVDEHFELKKKKNHFALGEMLDYDAPTGGYLLQSCFSMGKYLADYLNK